MTTTPPGARTWLTSDLHFGHSRINDYAGRPYGSVEQADDDLIARWNGVVAPGDTVHVLGDYALGDLDRGLSHLARLNGTKHLISGNHDKCWPGHDTWHRHMTAYLDAGFETIAPFGTLKLPPTRKGQPKRRVMLSHFPYDADHTADVRYAQFRLRDHGVPLLHGHVHQAYQSQRSALGTVGINVGVDVWDFTPVAVEVLAQMIEDLDPRPDPRP